MFVFLFCDFLVDTEIPMKCDLLFFLLHNLSQAELRVEKVIVPKKTPASNSIKKFPFEWSWRQDVKVTHAQQLQKRVSVWSKSQCIPHTSQA